MSLKNKESGNPEYILSDFQTIIYIEISVIVELTSVSDTRTPVEYVSGHRVRLDEGNNKESEERQLGLSEIDRTQTTNN